MSPEIKPDLISLKLSFLNAVGESLAEIFRIDFIELEVRKHSAELGSGYNWRLFLIEFSGVEFPENEAQQLRRVQSVTLLPFNTGDHEFLEAVEYLFDGESVGGNGREMVEVAPVRVG